MMVHPDFRSDYYGLPSNPISVYHTGAPWRKPTGPEAQRVPKEIRPVLEHPIADVWNELGLQVIKYLDSVNIMWTTIDPVRFAEVEEAPGPVFLWVGVKPGSLSHENAEVAAGGCKKLLEKFEISDVEVAFRESLFSRSAGPKLLRYVSSRDATADVQTPLTPALGLRIAARATPHVEGTGSIYICEGGESKRVLILTTRHTVLSANTGRYTHTKGSQSRQDVLLLGSKAYQDVLESITIKIEDQAFLIDHYNDALEFRKAGNLDHDLEAQTKEQETLERLLKKTEKTIDPLKEFHGEVMRDWYTESQRVLGHIVYSPPISVSAKYFTEDWALIELHGKKIDWEVFRGNVIDLGTKMSIANFMRKMYPNPLTRACFHYPWDRLFPLQGIIKEDELRHPTTVDPKGEPCLIVVKSGNSTGVTIGRATGIKSFVREYFEDGTHRTSMELAIYPYSHKDGAFSAPGDSGSIIADGKGRIVGLLTGGAGKADSIDVTYATPFDWLFEECVKAHFPNAYLYPTKA